MLKWYFAVKSLTLGNNSRWILKAPLSKVILLFLRLLQAENGWYVSPFASRTTVQISPPSTPWSNGADPAKSSRMFEGIRPHPKLVDTTELLNQNRQPSADDGKSELRFVLQIIVQKRNDVPAARTTSSSTHSELGYVSIVWLRRFNLYLKSVPTVLFKVTLLPTKYRIIDQSFA